jgi:hypothetical protein
MSKAINLTPSGPSGPVRERTLPFTTTTNGRLDYFLSLLDLLNHRFKYTVGHLLSHWIEELTLYHKPDHPPVYMDHGLMNYQ